MKKLAVLTALLLLLSGVGYAGQAAAQEKMHVVATTFPIYDWTRQVLGERAQEVELHLLQDSGIDLHNFQPTVQDIVKVSSADVFIYIGGLSDAWVADALKEAVNPDMHSLELMVALGDAVKQDAMVEGMQESPHAHQHEHDEGERDAHVEHDAAEEHADLDHETEHDHQAEHDHEAEHEAHTDEHIWLSLRNAQTLVEAIARTLGEADPEHQEEYATNAQAYNEKLQQLDNRYEEAVASVETPVLLFGDRFPFRYLMDDYGITYYAAFSGCSAETEASFQTIAFLADKADHLQLKAVLILDGSDGRLADAVVRASQGRNQQVLRMNAMQSLSREDVEQGATYLSIMEENLSVLEQAL